MPWIRAVAEQTLEDEVVQDEGGKLIKTRFRPFGVVRGSPASARRLHVHHRHLLSDFNVRTEPPWLVRGDHTI